MEHAKVLAIASGFESEYSKRIREFNGMYRMQISSTPTLRIGERGPSHHIANFVRILDEEVAEVATILAHVRALEAGQTHYVDPREEDETKAHKPCDHMQALTDLADWLMDIQVYCASEMAKFGIPFDGVMRIVMASNASKLQADGTALFVENKLQKGPNYWKPEPAIYTLLNGYPKWHEQFQTPAN